MFYHDCKGFTLEKDGVQVIDNVIPNTKTLQNLMWHYLGHLTKNTDYPIIKEDTNSYKTLFKFIPSHGYLLQHYDVGQNPMSWEIRQNDNVINEFKNLYHNKIRNGIQYTKDMQLLTSFDGIAISLPPEYTNRGYFRNGIQHEWFHTDQSYNRSKCEIIQGEINLFDVNEGDSTLRFLRSSHKYHSDFKHENDISKYKNGDWCKLEESDKEFYIDKLSNKYDNYDICVKTKAGSLVLWDSRTIHCGIEPQRNRKNINIRCCIYVCMTPKDWLINSKKTLKRRINVFEKHRTSNHYPNDRMKMFSEKQNTYNSKKIILPKVENYPLIVTEKMKKLVGYD